MATLAESPQPEKGAPLPPSSTVFNRELVPLSLAFFLLAASGYSIQQFVIPWWQEQRGFSAAQASSLLAAAYGAMAIARARASLLLKLLGGYELLIGGMLVNLLWVIAAFTVTSYAGLFVASCLWGAFAGVQWVASGSLVTETVTADKRGAASGYFFLHHFGGLALGVFGFGWLLGRWGIEVAALTTAFVCASATFVALLAPIRQLRPVAVSLKTVFAQFHEAKLKMAAVALFVGSLGLGAVFGPFSTLVADRFGLALLGSIIVGFHVGRLAFSLIVGRLSDLFGREVVLSTGFLLAACGMALASQQQVAWTVVVAAVGLGIAHSVSNVIATALAGDVATPELKVQTMSGLWVFQDLAVVLSVLGGQWLKSWSGGFALPFGITAAIFAATGLVALLFARSRFAKGKGACES